MLVEALLRAQARALAPRSQLFGAHNQRVTPNRGDIRACRCPSERRGICLGQASASTNCLRTAAN